MKDVIERLEADATALLQVGEGRMGADLKALLSYTKQCEEALRPFADLYLQHDKDGHPEDDRCAWGFNDVDLTWGAFRKALSLIQQGE